MSAIGNYIYYSASNYYMGNQNATGKQLGQSDLKYRNKEAINARKHQEQLINDRYKNSGNKQMARQMEELFNLFTSMDEDIAAQQLKDSGIDVNEVKKSITKRFNEIAKRNTQNSLAQKDIDFIRMSLDNKQVHSDVMQAVSKLKTGKGIKSPDDLIDALNDLLTQMMKHKKTTLDYLNAANSSTGAHFDTTIKGRIGILINFLKNASKQVSAKAEAYYNSDAFTDVDRQWLDEYTAIVFKKNSKDKELNTRTKFGGFMNAIHSIDYSNFEGLHNTTADRKKMYGNPNKKIQGAPILSNIVSLINILQTPPPSTLGTLAEASVEVLINRLPSYLNASLNASANVVGGDKVRYIVPKEQLMSDILHTTIKEEYKSYYKDDKGKIIEDKTDSGVSYRITGYKIQPKADVVFSYKTKEGKLVTSGVSVKRSTYGNIIHFLKDGNMYNLISSNNEENFINHYINIMAPHYADYKNSRSIVTKRFHKDEKGNYTDKNVVTTAGKLARQDNLIIRNAREKYAATMQLVMATNAMFGNRRKVYNPVNSFTRDSVNYLAIFVNNNNDLDKGYWYVKTVSDIYKNLININNSPIIVTSSKTNNSRYGKLSPFGMNDFGGVNYFARPPVTGDVAKVNQVIADRISKTLAVLHKQKITVYMQNTALSKVYDSVRM